jgi:3-oxoacyl-[acyl-carrier-protein] synthase-3
VHIKAIENYLPELCLTNEMIQRQNPSWDIDKISAKTGIYTRTVARENITSGDLAFCAAEKIFSNNIIGKEERDFLLFCTQTPDYFLPTTACILQERLGLSTDIGALDYNLGCSGYIYGLSLAKALITSDIARNVLLLTGETYSKLIYYQDKNNIALFGDGASATVLSAQKGIAEIGHFSFGTDGTGAKNLIVKNGAFRHKELDGRDVVNEEGVYVRNDNYLYMNGSEIFNFTSESIPLLIQKTLRKNNIKIEYIDLFVFHQANKYMLNFIRKLIGIPQNKFYIDEKNTGNTVSATIPLAIKNAIDEGKIKKNTKVLIAGFGVGYSYGAVLLYF